MRSSHIEVVVVVVYILCVFELIIPKTFKNYGLGVVLHVHVHPSPSTFEFVHTSKFINGIEAGYWSNGGCRGFYGGLS